LLWSAKSDPEAEKALRMNFLGEHSPLGEFVKYVTTPPKKGAHPELVRFRLQLDAELAGIDRRHVLRRVDATKPSRDPLAHSYRYPFQDASGSFQAPCDCKATEWDAYQGPRATVVRAIERLLDLVEPRAKLPTPP
jgi:hypothetical protein